MAKILILLRFLKVVLRIEFCSENVVVLHWIDLEARSGLGNTLVIAEAIAASTVRQANNGSLVSRPAISLAEMLFGFLQENFQFFFRHLPMISKAIQMSPDLASTQHLYFVARLVEKKGRLFPRPPKHHQCSTTSCCIFSDMFA